MRNSLATVMTLALLAAAPVAATVVTGQVTDASDNGVFDVDLDFIDRDTGSSIPLVNDDTDVLGFYAVSVPPGDYDVRFKPAPGVALVAVELRGVKVEGGSMTIDRQLDPGWFVSGHVRDQAGLPVYPLDLDVIDVIDGNALFVANDGTQPSGDFSIVLPAGQFDIELEPPQGSMLVPQRLSAVDVAGNTPLGNIDMTTGVRLRGGLIDASLLPAGQVQVRTLDPASGEEIFNIRNTTAADGRFELVVAPGALDLLLVPPRGSVLLPRLVGGVRVFAELDLPDIVLDAGVLAGGTVLDPSSGPAEGIDLDFVSEWTGLTRFTPRDNTDADGVFSVAVPPGVYTVRYDPPPPSALAPAEAAAVVLAAPTATLPTVQLQGAVLVSGVVQSGGGVPQAGIDLDFLAPGGGIELPSSRDTTDATGAFTATVNPDVYDVRFNPLPASGMDQVTVAGVSALADVDLGVVTLPSATPATVSGFTPVTGPSSGGTTVTVTGAGFAPGAAVTIGSAELRDVTVLGPGTIQGTTREHPAGNAVVRVVNPGAAPAQAALPFAYTLPAADPLLTVSKSGELGTDLRLDWTATGRPHYVVFSGAQPQPELLAPLDATSDLSLRVEAGASPYAAGVRYFVVH